TVYPVLVDPGPESGPGEALKAVKEQLRRIPGNGLGYGLLRYGAQETGLVESGSSEDLQGEPQVSFNYLGQLDQALPEGALFRPAGEAAGAPRSPRQPLEFPLQIDAQVAGGRLKARWSFSPDQLPRDTVSELAGRFISGLSTLVAHCLDPEAGGFTASDFALTELDEDELAEAFDEIDFGD
ncbi:MAG: condensation domain-containing protein, partial [Acidobacteriota bacterium]|nr:condensation domain-containing protein [Acidobacteriota bacterium]